MLPILRFAKNVFFTFLLFSISGLLRNVSAQNFTLHEKVNEWQFQVGFMVESVYDQSRAYSNDNKRPIQISVWYPAVLTNTDSYMTFGDYVLLTTKERQFSDISDTDRKKALANFKSFPLNDKFSDTVAKEIFDMQMPAIKNAQKREGKYPVVYIAQGNHGSAYHHALLAEYLAGNGYVVVTNPSSTRLVYDELTMSASMNVILDHVRDIMFTMNYINRFENIDAGKTAMLGFSLGGNTGGGVFIANPAIDAMLCLDCGFGSSFGVPGLKAMQTYKNAITRESAILNMHKSPDPMHNLAVVNDFTNSRSYDVAVRNAKHFDFTVLGKLASMYEGIVGDKNWLSGGERSKTAHAASLKIVLDFLDIYIKKQDKNLGKSVKPYESSGITLKVINTGKKD